MFLEIRIWRFIKRFLACKVDNFNLKITVSFKLNILEWYEKQSDAGKVR